MNLSNSCYSLPNIGQVAVDWNFKTAEVFFNISGNQFVGNLPKMFSLAWLSRKFLSVDFIEPHEAL